MRGFGICFFYLVVVQCISTMLWPANLVLNQLHAITNKLVGSPQRPMAARTTQIIQASV